MCVYVILCFVCVLTDLPASCYDLLALGKTTDDEYGVYPQILNGAKVRVYCHDMNTDSPKEYITLMKPNVGEIPNLSDETCTGTIPHAKVEEHTGKTAFSKIRVDIAVSYFLKGIYV